VGLLRRPPPASMPRATTKVLGVPGTPRAGDQSAYQARPHAPPRPQPRDRRAGGSGRPGPTASSGTSAGATAVTRGSAAPQARVRSTIFADFSDILGDFFGFGDVLGAGAAAQGRGPAQLISFEEAAFSTETNPHPQAETCSTCSAAAPPPAHGPPPPDVPRLGAGHVPAGSSSVAACSTAAGRAGSTGGARRATAGTRSRHRNLRSRSPGGPQTSCGGRPAPGPPFDLYVVLRVAEHAFFKREHAPLREVR
jgi:molecular chaperone DnaJ